ncbi:hypothetical protein ACTUVK_002129 [Stenotrophomonas rhizophila]|jgi:hypothetical protein|uniref:Uncharacterized protein n=1 Tax=Stenotrophomonas nematodicola TaxID=2656746 RepID=A0ABW7D168_9GAMM|nr:hypothetical protein [Stenotrophomonas sp. BIGb0135]MCS4236060.1 hypothetical protein [Stenotrophomonas sp. BIGb0135]
MTCTGVFELIEVNVPTEARDARASWLSSVAAACVACKRHFTASGDNGLQLIPGGVAITCPGCKTRQAISRARFDGLLRQERQG